MEEMGGQYDSYGRVFKEMVTTIPPVSYEWEYADWGEMVDMSFDEKDDSTGFAVYHERCIPAEYPATISGNDPNQGWGRYKKSDDWDSWHIVYKKKEKVDSDEWILLLHGLVE
jgi:hypothetical protein